ncbi:DUF2652 domain-containing protein [Candidatus Entotheonella palauensis]|uniref:DUF2652 domain-containing protein n=1 Tax=Candidatus Entotheonella palauensis TaxID=93172 RepID=UPI000B7D6447|nr:DUF2652 domain-containing protein [Candidatus Entotheonella palauensis]
MFIPDISGFSDFVNATELTHSRHIISELLGLIIDANRLDMDVSEVEGDAVLFYKFHDVPTPEQLLEQAEHMFVEFHSHLRQYATQRICQCGACSSAPGLTLKMVAHVGELDKISIKGHEKLHGSDLILAHRLLKNDVPIHEYLLITEAVNHGHGQARNGLEGNAWELGKTSYADFGEVSYRYLSLSELHKKVSDPPKPTSGTRTENPVIQEVLIDSPLQDVFEVVTNFDYRLHWNKGVKTVDYEKDKVNRVGTKHVCVFDNRTIEFETVTSQFGPNKIAYGEKLNDVPPFLKEMTLYYIMEEKDKKTLLSAEWHYVLRGLLLKPMTPLLKRKFAATGKLALNQIKTYAESKQD